MQSNARAVPNTRAMLWTGRVVSALPALFLLVDGVMKVIKPAPVVEAMSLLGYPDHLAVGIGLLELACLAVYLLPRAAVVGAVLLTGYLGGAVATHVRIGSEPFSIVFPIILGALLWGGLILRDERARAIFSSRG